MTENQPSTVESKPAAAPGRKTDARSALIGAGIVILVLLGFAAGRWMHSGSTSAPASTSSAAGVTQAAPASALPAADASAAPATAAAAAAAPAAAPQVATAAAPAGSNGSVVGAWSGKFQWHGGAVSTMHWQFSADGTMLGTSGITSTQQALWQWRQRGDEVEISGAGNIYYGTIKGDSMSGTMQVFYKNGGVQNSGIFDATRSQ